jgi:hypothetical protein
MEGCLQPVLHSEQLFFKEVLSGPFDDRAELVDGYFFQV